MKGWGRIVLSAALITLLTSCAGERYHRQGLTLLKQGKTEEGLFKLEKALKKEPDNVRFRFDVLSRRAEQINRLLQDAQAQQAQAKWEEAQTLYKQVQAIEPANVRAAEGLEAMQRARVQATQLQAAQEAFKQNDLERTLEILRLPLTDNPAHTGALALKRQVEGRQLKQKLAEPLLQLGSKKPINLEFRDANIKVVFEALARTTGVNFIFDQDVRPDLRTTVFLRQSSLEDAINLILQTNRLEKKILNRNTMLIYPNTPEKLKEYQELVVKGFYLANADVKQTQSMLKGLLKTKDMFIDEKLNLLVMRDTPEAIRLAEKLIAMHDLYEPEVMLEVAVLEIQRSRLLELGVQWPNQLVLTPLSGAGGMTLTDLKNINSDRISAALGGATLKLQRVVGDAKILANPRIRARNREKAKIMIGDKVPVSNSTTTATGVVSESVQYLDVGIKLDVEPNVYLQDEIAIKIGLEVSAITNEVHTPAGSLAYQIGSRSASTVLRLKDGETQVLAGLINDEDRVAASRVPALGDIPLLGRLFGNQKDSRNKTEIVLSITPHLIRNINRPDAAASEFWSGTESALRTRPLTLPVARSADKDASAVDAAKSAGNEDANVSDDAAAEAIKANAAPSAITLSWQGPNQVKVGEQFKLALKVKADGGVRSLPFQLDFDSSAFQVVSITEGPFFQQRGGQASISSNIDVANNKIFASIVRAGVDGAYGESDAAILTLKALAPKPQTEIKLLSSAPIGSGDKTVAPVLPAPFAIKIVE